MCKAKKLTIYCSVEVQFEHNGKQIWAKMSEEVLKEFMDIAKMSSNEIGQEILQLEGVNIVFNEDTNAISKLVLTENMNVGTPHIEEGDENNTLPPTPDSQELFN